MRNLPSIMGAQIIGRRSPPPLRSSPTVSVSSSSSTRCTVGVGIGPTRSALHTTTKHSKYSRTTKCAALLAGLLVIVWLESISVMVSLHHNDLVDSNASVHHHLPIPMSSRKLRAAANHLRHTRTQKQQQKQQHTLSSGNKLPKHYIQLSPPTATNNHHTNHHSSTATASAAAQHPWSYPIIHIVTTRFMQGQGTLVNLARSRLKLLQVICLPSIASQTILGVNNNNHNHDTLLEVYSYTKWEQEVAKMLKNVNARQQQQQQQHYNSKQILLDPAFIWIIKVDPNIDRHVLSELLTILEPVKQFTLVVGSNTNYGIGIKPGGWRDGQAGQDVLDAYDNGHVYFPSGTSTTAEEGDEEGSAAMMQMLRRAHEARNERVIIETRLDADDAVNVDYLAALQQTAVRTLIDPNVSGYDGSTDDDDNANEESNDAKSQQQQQQQVEIARWLYLCPHTHVQWNPSSSTFDGGSSDTKDDNSTPGMLQVFQMPNTCVTAGLSIAFAVGTGEKDVPRYEHSKIFWEITIHHNHEGKQTRNSTTASTTDHFGNNTTTTTIDKHDCGLYPSSKCAVFVDDPKVSAFRSRAMTSAGMHNIEARGEPTVATPQHYKEIAAKLWQHSIEKNFGISSQKAKEAAAFMSRNYLGTVRDNLRGQCTSGHSCKISSLEKLQRTIDLIEEEAGGVEII